VGPLPPDWVKGHTVNDWRKRAGMESAADGDVYVVPLNSEIVAQGGLKQAQKQKGR